MKVKIFSGTVEFVEAMMANWLSSHNVQVVIQMTQSSVHSHTENHILTITILYKEERCPAPEF